MAYKEKKLTKDEAYAMYNGINAGMNKKKSSASADKKSKSNTKNKSKGK